MTGEGPRRGSRGGGGVGVAAGSLPPPFSPSLPVPRGARRRAHPARGGLGRARGWLSGALVPSRPAREEEEEEGEGGDAKVGQECNWTLRTRTHLLPRPHTGSGGPRKPWKASLLPLWFPSIIGGRLPGDPEGCVSL